MKKKAEIKTEDFDEKHIDKVFKKFIYNKELIEKMVNSSGVFTFDTVTQSKDNKEPKSKDFNMCLVGMRTKDFNKFIAVMFDKFGIVGGQTAHQDICYDEESMIAQNPRAIELNKVFMKTMIALGGEEYTKALRIHRNEKIEKARSSIESTKKTIQWLSIQKKTAIADPLQMEDLLSREEEKNRRAEKNLKLHLKLLADLIEVSASSQKQ